MGFRRAALGNLRFDPRMGPSRGASVTSEETALIDLVRSAGSEVVWVPLLQVKHYVDPRRMRLPYLMRYCHELAMGQVMRHGAPEGATIAGVPRWVLRVTVTHVARAFWKALTGDRVETLVSLRTCSYFSGIARQSYRTLIPGGSRRDTVSRAGRGPRSSARSRCKRRDLHVQQGAATTPDAGTAFSDETARSSPLGTHCHRQQLQ